MLTLENTLLVAAVFLLAGWVKGVVGMGLPTVSMGVLGIVLAPAQAAALLIIPSTVTNIWQFVAGPAPWAVARRLASLLVLACIGTAIGIPLLTSGSSRWPSVALGAVLAVYGVLALLSPRLAVPGPAQRWLSPVVGGVTGIVSGATGVFVVPLVPYLSAMGFEKDELIQALGLSFTISTLALGLALGVIGSYPFDILILSIGAVLPALLGMFVGQRVRDRIDQATFRKGFFLAMIVVGGYMVLRGFAAR